MGVSVCAYTDRINGWEEYNFESDGESEKEKERVVCFSAINVCDQKEKKYCS